MRNIASAFSLLVLVVGCGQAKGPSSMMASTHESVASTELVCISETDAGLYFEPHGKVVFEADVSNETLLLGASLQNKAGGNAGIENRTLTGLRQGDYVRFSAADSWCGYKITLKSGFSTRDRSTMFVNAYCEGTNGVNSIKLICQ